MSDAPTAEQHPWHDDALRLFMNGQWQQLGITEDSELAVLGQIYSYTPDKVPVRLLWRAKQIWDRHKARILADWERKLEEAEADPDCYKCRTCPHCGCPGME